MALSAVLRRTMTSAAAPLNSRVLRGGRAGLCYFASSLVRPVVNSSGLAQPEHLGRAISAPTSRFFSVHSYDSGLLRAIDDELKSVAGVVDSEDPQKMFPFEIKDNPGTNYIVLTREFEGEKIEIHASMPILTSDGAAGGGDENPTLPLVIKVAKQEGDLGLEFTCTGYADEVCIDFVSIVDKNSETENDLAYEGPEFSDLDENLQKAFTKYLEIRGISPATINYLHEYMIKKDERECLRWLKYLKEFTMK